MTNNQNRGNAFRARQAWAIARIELRRAFLSKRAFWVYFLALFPTLMFVGHAIEVMSKQQRYSARQIVAPAVIDGVTQGQTAEEVLKQIGRPVQESKWTNRRRVMREEGGKRIWEEKRTEMRYMMAYDGKRRAMFWFENGVLRDKNVEPLANFAEDRQIYAGVFQFFYLRLAIFFGCVGIFMNLFRGEMLDKTLHFWFLAPARREVLLAGKYAAGLIASSVIFAGGALLCFAAMMWPHDPAEVQAYWQGPGFSHAVWYAAAAALGCLGYGSVFLAAGLLLRNPIIPAAVMLLWEGINGFLPAIMQRLSILYYLQSICPVPAPLPPDMPTIARLLLAPAEPASKVGAVLGLLVLTALVLWVGSRAVRRIEISYATE